MGSSRIEKKFSRDLKTTELLSNLGEFTHTLARVGYVLCDSGVAMLLEQELLEQLVSGVTGDSRLCSNASTSLSMHARSIFKQCVLRTCVRSSSYGTHVRVCTPKKSHAESSLTALGQNTVSPMENIFYIHQINAHSNKIQRQ